MGCTPKWVMIHDCSWHQFIRVIYICVCPPERVIEQGMREKYDEQLMMIAPQDVPVCVVLAQKKQCGKPNDKPSSLISPSMGFNHHVEILGLSLGCPH